MAYITCGLVIMLNASFWVLGIYGSLVKLVFLGGISRTFLLWLLCKAILHVRKIASRDASFLSHMGDVCDFLTGPFVGKQQSIFVLFACDQFFSNVKLYTCGLVNKCSCHLPPCMCILVVNLVCIIC